MNSDLTFENAYPFSEIVEINPPRQIKKGTVAKYVSMESVEPRRKHVSKIEYRTYNGGSKFKNSDILFARITPSLEHGKTCIVDFLEKGEIGVGSTEFIVITSKEGKTIPDYVYYLAISDLVREPSIKSMTGTSGRQRVDIDIFDSIIVPIPPIGEQKAIAKILSDLDSKIELNQTMNKTLEAFAQAIFKHWFIDFEFPNEEGKPYKSSGGEMVDSELGEIPKGWEVKKLSEVANFLKGFGYKGSEKSDARGDYVFITLNNVLEGGGFKRKYSFISSKRVKEKHFVKEGDIVIPNTEQTKTGRLIGFPAFVEFPLDYQNDVGVFSHHITKVMPIPLCFTAYLWFYLLFHQKETIKYHTGTGVWGLDVKGWINNEYCLIPNDHLVCLFEGLSKIFFKRQLINNKFSDTLCNVRDRLLPKLMLGKIRVPLEE